MEFTAQEDCESAAIEYTQSGLLDIRGIGGNCELYRKVILRDLEDRFVNFNGLLVRLTDHVLNDTGV